MECNSNTPMEFMKQKFVTNRMKKRKIFVPQQRRRYAALPAEEWSVYDVECIPDSRMESMKQESVKNQFKDRTIFFPQTRRRYTALHAEEWNLCNMECVPDTRIESMKQEFASNRFEMRKESFPRRRISTSFRAEEWNLGNMECVRDTRMKSMKQESVNNAFKKRKKSSPRQRLRCAAFRAKKWNLCNMECVPNTQMESVKQEFVANRYEMRKESFSRQRRRCRSRKKKLPPGDESVECVACGRRFTGLVSFCAHLSTKGHRDRLLTLDSDSRQLWESSISCLKTQLHDLLRRHEPDEFGKLYCEFCDVTANSAKTLLDHFNGHNHTENVREAVEQMNMSAYSERVQELVREVELREAGIFKCELCSVSSRSKVSYTFHMRSKRHQLQKRKVHCAKRILKLIEEYEYAHFENSCIRSIVGSGGKINGFPLTCLVLPSNVKQL